MREALNGTGSQRAPVVDAPAETPRASVSNDVTPARRQIIRGSQNFVRPPAPAAGAKTGAEPGGDIVFNFTDQPIEAVINSVMGDLLHEKLQHRPRCQRQCEFSASSR